MANKDMAYGFKPSLHFDGSPWNGQTMRCFISASDAVASYIGDPVLQTGDGCHRGCCPQVKLAITGQAGIIFGVTASFEPYQDAWCGNFLGIADPTGSGDLVHRLAATERFANVVINPDVVYQIQGDSTTVIAVTAVGSNMDWIVNANAASAALGLSSAEIVGNSSATDDTEPLWLMGAVARSDNDVAYVCADWYVLLNTHCFGLTSGAAGLVDGI